MALQCKQSDVISSSGLKFTLCATFAFLALFAVNCFPAFLPQSTQRTAKVRQEILQPAQKLIPSRNFTLATCPFSRVMFSELSRLADPKRISTFTVSATVLVAELLAKVH